MMEMKPLMKVAPSEEIMPHRETYDKAFAFAYRYSKGCDLVEEMVATKHWPLGKSRPSFKAEMVNLPVYGEAGGIPFPHFGIALSKDETLKDFVSSMEQETREIVDDITDKRVCRVEGRCRYDALDESRVRGVRNIP